MNVDAPSNDANEEEGEDTNGEENTALDAHDDTPTDDSGEPPADLWDLKKIYTTKDILKSNAVKCMGDKCRLVACSIWSSTSIPKSRGFIALVSCCVQLCVVFDFSIKFETTSHRPSLTPTRFFPMGMALVRQRVSTMLVVGVKKIKRNIELCENYHTLLKVHTQKGKYQVIIILIYSFLYTFTYQI